MGRLLLLLDTATFRGVAYLLRKVYVSFTWYERPSTLFETMLENCEHYFVAFFVSDKLLTDTNKCIALYQQLYARLQLDIDVQ